MAVHQKLSEIGWFYHAPKRRIAMEQVLAPPPSQIPGLSDVSQIPEEAPPRTVFRDTDTKYVRLAKMGGRPGLLHMKEFTPKTTDAQPYQRNNWFYLEDNAVEDAAAKANDGSWVFRLPEYMVHDEFKPIWPDGVPPAHLNRGAARGEAAAAVVKAKSASDAAQATLIRVDHYERAKRLQEEALRSKYSVPPQLYDQKERPIMSKLMSYGYVSDWKKVRDDWYTVEQTRKDAEEKVKAEQESSAAAAARAAAGDKQQQKRGLQKLLKSRKNKDEELEKEPFKLTRFSNVHAKVSTRRNVTELPAAAS